MSSRSRRTQSQLAKSHRSTHSPTSSGGTTPEEGAGHRQARLEHILLDELQSLIRDEATDPAVQGVSVLAVNLSPDGGHARIAYAVVTSLSREQEVRHSSKEGLARATNFLRARLAQQLSLKKLPKLAFTFVGVAEAAGETGGDSCPE